MLVRYTPRFANAASPSLFDLAFTRMPDMTASAPASVSKVDILEKDGGLEFICDVPGSSLKDVNVTIENGILTIRAERKTEYTKAAVYQTERSKGEFTRSFKLDETYDTNQVSATLQDGVLVVHVAKHPEAGPKRIPIRVAAGVTTTPPSEKANEASRASVPV